MTFWFCQKTAALRNYLKTKDSTWHSAFTFRKKQTFLLPKFTFLFISQLGFWLKHIWKRKTKPGPIIQRRTSCLPLKSYKNKIWLTNRNSRRFPHWPLISCKRVDFFLIPTFVQIHIGWGIVSKNSKNITAVSLSINTGSKFQIKRLPLI